jgi:hypothetical protein
MLNVGHWAFRIEDLLRRLPLIARVALCLVTPLFGEQQEPVE